MGKHFKVEADVNGKSVKRYYSFVVANIDDWRREVRESGYDAKEYTKAFTNNNEIMINFKYYDQGKMTNYLANLNIGDSLNLTGPMGPGLMLNDTSKGAYLAFAGGTGILTFLDLIHHIWSDPAPKIILYIYVSFTFETDDFVSDLLKATQERHPKNFKYILNVGRCAVLTPNVLDDWVDFPVLKRAWICGPSGFNQWIYNMLRYQSYHHKRIIVI